MPALFLFLPASLPGPRVLAPAIHRAAGDALLHECLKLPEQGRGVRCPTGTAVITGAGALACRHVIHTVGPIYDTAEASAPLLRQAIVSCLEVASENGIRSIAFPAISCGVYGYPFDEAAEVIYEALESKAWDGLQAREKAAPFFLLGGRGVLGSHERVCAARPMRRARQRHPRVAVAAARSSRRRGVLRACRFFYLVASASGPLSSYVPRPCPLSMCVA